MPEPRDADFMTLRVWDGFHRMAGLARREECGNQDIAEELEIALPPSLLGQQSHLVFMFSPALREETLLLGAGVATGGRRGIIDHELGKVTRS